MKILFTTIAVILAAVTLPLCLLVNASDGDNKDPRQLHSRNKISSYSESVFVGNQINSEDSRKDFGRTQSAPTEPRLFTMAGSPLFSQNTRETTHATNERDTASATILSGTYSTIDVPGAAYTSAIGINNNGEIVGDFSGLDLHYLGFKLSGGNYTTIKYPGSTTTQIGGINDNGDIVGSYDDGGVEHGFKLSGGTYSTIDVPGAAYNGAVGINNNGEIVGDFSGLDLHYLGFKLSGGNYTTIKYPGSTTTQIGGINDNGDIVGSYNDDGGVVHSFKLSGGTYSTIDVPGAAYTSAIGINNNGEIVGDFSGIDLHYVGFKLSGGNYTTIKYPGSTTTQIGGINDNGDIVGSYNDDGGVVHGFKLSSVELLGLEVTQAVQDLGNNVPLVADKPTFIRAYVKPTTVAMDGLTVSATLVRTNSGGVTNSKLTPSNPGGRIRLIENPQRSTLLDSFNFELPPEWIKAGTLQFKIESPDAAIICHEQDSVPDCGTTVTFNTVNPLSIKFLLQTYKDRSGVAHTSTMADYLRAANEILGRYPIDRLDSVVGTATTQIVCPPDFGLLNIETNSLRNTECLTGTCKKYYQALLTDGISNPTNCILNKASVGQSDLPGHASAAYAEKSLPNVVDPDISDTRVHELGHGTGLKHTDGGKGEACGDAAGSPVACTRPQGDSKLSLSKDQYGPQTAYGFDVNNTSPTRRIFEANTYDFMSYNGPTWMSRANYVTLYNQFRVENAQAENAENVDVVTVAQAVNISGSVLLNATSGSIGSVFVSNTGGIVTMPSPGTYAIRFESSQGTQLASYSFEPTAGSGDITVGSIALQLPWDPATKRIVLLHNGQVLASRQASANSPTVRVTSPNGGETLIGTSATLTWTASDQDGDPLTYLLEYSSDNGATWNGLAVNWASTSFPVDTAMLAASSQALFRVIASDGLNNAQDQSDAVFIVPAHAPQAFISTPENNHLYVGQQTIILNGMGYDTEEGLLAGPRLSWNSSLNGFLGTGASIAVNASTLVEGTHTITLTATDGTARTGTASISIRVFRSRPVLPDALAVAPTGLTFSVASGTLPTAAQILAIRNSGDGNLTWSATVNQPWIKMDAATGSAPFNLAITAVPTGLAVGQYKGSVTITSAGTTNSPQTVPVIFYVTQAPPATVSGRVLTPDSRGLRNAIVSITDSQGVVQTALTTSFGVFTFGNVAGGQTYTLRISSKRYRFSTQTLQVSGNLTLPDFVGLE